MDRGIGSWVTRQADAGADRVALSEGDRVVTWGAFEERTNRLSRGLLALGVRRGDRVALFLAAPAGARDQDRSIRTLPLVPDSTASWASTI